MTSIDQTNSSQESPCIAELGVWTSFVGLFHSLLFVYLGWGFLRQALTPIPVAYYWLTTILLPQLHTCWVYRCGPPYPINLIWITKSWTLSHCHNKKKVGDLEYCLALKVIFYQMVGLSLSATLPFKGLDQREGNPSEFFLVLSCHVFLRLERCREGTGMLFLFKCRTSG